jgi:AcrR family transcriptional regulator
MPTAHMRKKDPEAVRRSLLDHAAKLAAEHGITAVTTQAVAEGAGVTKGGLFHHFANKEALLDAMVADILRSVDETIDAIMAQDDDPHGAFTRAYVACALDPAHHDLGSAWKALGIALAADDRLLWLWSNWLDARLERHAATDGELEHEIARLAADGAWLVLSEDATHRRISLQELRRGLDRLTRRGASTTNKPLLAG